jgi:hypothetical protein
VTATLTAADVLAFRIHAQQLDRPVAERPVTDATILDLGVQDTGRDGASWALANRGVPVSTPEQLASSRELALVWTLRGAPHYYRRQDLADVLVATSPMSDADAASRMIGAAKPLAEAGIGAWEGLAHLASQLQAVVRSPASKGDVSARLTAVLPEPYVRDCVPCKAVHSWEQPFRLGALHAGLELEPQSSPPVLRPIPDWPRREVGPAPNPLEAPSRLQVIRGYLRLLGPARPSDVAGFLDAPLAEVKAHWPEDAVEVQVEGRRAWSLGDLDVASAEPGLLRLLGPFDLLLQGRDRHLLVVDRDHHKALWPTLGRPGAVLEGARIVGTWRPKATGRRFSVTVTNWSSLSAAVRVAVEEQAALLAAHRQLQLTGVVWD